MNDRTKRFRERQRAVGGCMHCTAKAVKGMCLCERHRELCVAYRKKAWRNRKLRKYRESNVPAGS